ncbi:histone lysine acetyltransferase CREBBP-like [Haliotis rufescens]|uniref:histone lysine acetyltransferase CREBBP-like n=1 Tax=Haliotis rufescens TaxID=6454 RepID=UPI001EAFBADC|nr:histone lysine acetyltransferase CREBBP-like [Haliotis rufescens]
MGSRLRSCLASCVAFRPACVSKGEPDAEKTCTDEPVEVTATLKEGEIDTVDSKTSPGDGEQDVGDKPAPPKKTRKQEIEGYVQSLVHAVKCKDPSCTVTDCQRIREGVRHMQTCTKKMSGGCTTCKQLIALCCHHAKSCRSDDCQLQFCVQLKNNSRKT